LGSACCFLKPFDGGNNHDQPGDYFMFIRPAGPSGQPARGLARLLIAGVLVSASAAAFAQEKPALFKVVSARDEVVIGLASGDVVQVGGNDATHIGQALKSKGELTVWQYSIRYKKDNSGDREWAPLKRVSLSGHDSLRVEPFNPAPLGAVAAP
jgi:hypothetical protein